MSDPVRRVLPHNLDAEASVLGGIILRNEVLARLNALEPEYFYDQRHRWVFAAVRSLERRRGPIDVVTLETELEKLGKLQAAGGIAFLGDLALRVPDPDNVVAYAATVIDAALARRAALRMSELIERIYGVEQGGRPRPPLRGEELVVELAELAGDASRDRPMNDLIDMSAVVKEEFERIELIVDDRIANKPIDLGAPTGMAAIDEFIAGLPRGETTVVAARPKNGKTLVTDEWLDYAADWAFQSRKGVVVNCTNEDAPRQAAHRRMASASGIATARIARGDLIHVREAWRAGAAVAMQTKVKTIRVHGQSGAQVAAKIRRIHAEHGVALVKWDYLQNAGWPEGAKSPTEAVGRNMKDFVNTCNELMIPNIVCSQIKRPDKNGADDGYHTADDFKQAGDIEENAKLAFVLRDPWKYGKVEKGAICVYCNGKQPMRDSCWSCGGSALAKQDRRTGASVHYSRLELHVVLNAHGKPDVTFVVWWDRPCHRVLGLCRWCRSVQLAPGVLDCEKCASTPLHVLLAGPQSAQAPLEIDDAPPPSDDDLHP